MFFHPLPDAVLNRTVSELARQDLPVDSVEAALFAPLFPRGFCEKWFVNQCPGPGVLWSVDAFSFSAAAHGVVQAVIEIVALGPDPLGSIVSGEALPIANRPTFTIGLRGKP